MVCRLLTETIEYAILQLKSVFNRFVAHHEIFIGVILMELYKFNAVIIHLLHDGICQPFRSKCLSDTRSALKDDILFLFKNSYQTVILAFRHIDIF